MQRSREVEIGGGQGEMRITLLGSLVVLGTFLLVIYAIHVYQENNNRSDGNGDEKPHLPNTN